MASYLQSPSKPISTNTTSTSLIFKTISRSIQPPLSHRIVKEYNDLDYNINLNLIGKDKFKSLQLSRDKQKSRFIKNDKLQTNIDKRNSISAREKRKSFFEQQIKKINKSKQLYKNKQKRSLSLRINNKRPFSFTQSISYQPNQQHNNINKNNNNNYYYNKNKKNNNNFNNNNKIKNLSHQTITTRKQQQKYGLCQYQFRKTINGKLLTKPNIHLKFQNQVSRHSPQTTIYYNKDLQYDLSSSKQYRKILSKFHPFQSYTNRKVFQQDKNNTFYDRIYDIEAGKKISSPNKIKNIVSIEKIPGRQQDNLNNHNHNNLIKQDSYFSYDTQNAIDKIKKCSIKYTIRHSPREFKISKEVINKMKGCCR